MICYLKPAFNGLYLIWCVHVHGRAFARSSSRQVFACTAAVRDSSAGRGDFRRVPSPDKQQDEPVQTPLHGAQPDALDPDQLVGFVLTQAAHTARHDRDPLPWNSSRILRRISDSFQQFLLPVWAVTCSVRQPRTLDSDTLGPIQPQYFVFPSL